MQTEYSPQFVKARQRRRVVVYLMQNLRLRGRPPPIIFTRIVRSMNALQLCRSFHTKKLCVADLVSLSLSVYFKRSAILDRNQAFCVFEPHLVGAYGQRTIFILGSLDFLLVLLELFSLGVTAEQCENCEKITGGLGNMGRGTAGTEGVRLGERVTPSPNFLTFWLKIVHFDIYSDKNTSSA